MVRAAVDFYCVFYSIMSALILAYAANYNVFLQEKTNRTIHSLLSTPLTIRRVWLAKTLAVITVGYSLSIGLSILFLLVINNRLDASGFVYPSPHAVISLILINPVICFLIVGVIGIMTLISRDETKVRIGFFLLIFASLYFLNPRKVTVGFSMLPVQIILCAVLGGIVLVGLKLLVGERVITSVE
jgi:ABC-2 type transport system permease protein